MDIYKIKDFDGASDSEVAEVLRVTDLRQGVKNPNRVNIYINGEYAFSLDLVQVVDLKVKIGRVLTESEYAELKQASEFGKAYQRALEWTLARPRSVVELKDYLKKRGFKSEMKEKKKEWDIEREMADTVGKGEELDSKRLEKRLAKTKARERYDFDDLIVERLTEKGYVDDKKFAQWYVENRFVKKGVSRKRLQMELVKKGVSREIIDEVLSERDDEEEIKKMIARKRNKYDDEELVAYLCRQGFSYDLAKRLVEEN